MENEIIRAVLSGNPERFSYFIAEYKHMAYSIAFRMTGNKEDAEEIVQDSFVRAYKSLNKFRKDSKFSTWFYRIVVNRALSVSSAVKQIHEIDLDGIRETDFERIESDYMEMTGSERKKFINAALEKLPHEDGLLLTLFYLNENSIEEIADITGMKPENIKMKLSRARKKMYLVLEKMLKEDIKSLL
jgi:RNA polymerase sigma-70 factor (ECF subfamily)